MTGNLTGCGPSSWDDVLPSDESLDGFLTCPDAGEGGSEVLQFVGEWAKPLELIGGDELADLLPDILRNFEEVLKEVIGISGLLRPMNFSNTYSCLCLVDGHKGDQNDESKTELEHIG